jgi:cation transport ATPase
MSAGVTTTVLLISGMRNNACRETVAKSLQQVRGVRHAHVNLYRAAATVVHEAQCTPADLVKAVSRNGYSAVAEKKAKPT